MDLRKFAVMMEMAVDHSAQEERDTKKRPAVMMVIEPGPRVYVHRAGSDPDNWPCLDVLLGELAETDTAEAVERMIDTLWPECPRGTRVTLVSAGHALATSGMLAAILGESPAPATPEKTAPRAPGSPEEAISDDSVGQQAGVDAMALLGRYLDGRMSREELLASFPSEARDEVEKMIGEGAGDGGKPPGSGPVSPPVAS